MGSNNRSTARVFRDFTDAAILQFLSSLNTPRALSVWLLYRSGEHDQLTTLVCDPLNYDDSNSFRDDYAATSLLSKSDFLTTSFNREEVAIDKFLKSEERCRATNRTVLPFAPSGCSPPEALHPLIPRVRRQIERMLGSFRLEELLDSSDWGPGVSTLLKGPSSVKPNKYQSETGMTHEVYDVVWPLLHVAYPSWHKEILAKANASVEVGNVVITVPKNSKTDRVIAIEPGWNLWFQKGLGTMIRRRLLRCGCNLNDQTRNQRLSKDALKMELATIDFSSASDTIAFEVVRMLLPDEWFRILNLFRCRRGRLRDGTVLNWEKFSSMGNGFTFELESMIFYAIALVVTEQTCAIDDVEVKDRVSVFGDDVILPQASAPAFVELSELLGFKVNREKSFLHGRFFESCGAHWFDARDVKPFYLDKRIDTVPKCFGLHNRVVEFAYSCLGSVWGLDVRFKKLTRDLRSLVHSSDFCLVPRHYGDVGFFSNLDHALTLKTTKVIRMVGYKIRIRTERAVKLPFDGYGLVLERIRGTSLASEEGRSTRLISRSVKPGNGRGASFSRDEDTRFNYVSLKTTTMTVHRYPTVGAGQWFDFGLWV